MSNSEAIRSRWILGGAAVFAHGLGRHARCRFSPSPSTRRPPTTSSSSTGGILWYAANNHILNSTLMYGFTRVLGLSQFTARLPALIGAAFYISAAYRLCRLLGASLFVQLTLFVCLVFNPFIFDYLVAARGYGLALGFLMWALVYSAEAHLQRRPLCLAACAVSSAVRRHVRERQLFFRLRESGGDDSRFLSAPGAGARRTGLRLLAACVLPGAAVIHDRVRLRAPPSSSRAS